MNVWQKILSVLVGTLITVFVLWFVIDVCVDITLWSWHSTSIGAALWGLMLFVVAANLAGLILKIVFVYIPEQICERRDLKKWQRSTNGSV